MASLPQPLGERAPADPAVVLELALKGQSLESCRFVKDTIEVGRNPMCDLWVDNPGVSRNQFRIVREPGGELRIEDRGSANGTFLNDKPVTVATLRNGDVVQFGKYTVRVTVESPASVPLRIAPRTPSMQEGATVMLSASELRELMAEVQPAAHSTEPVRRGVPAVADPTPVRSSNAAVPVWVWWVATALSVSVVVAVLLLRR